MENKTAEEFFREKLKELYPTRTHITLSQELITAEQGLRWAHEFASQERLKGITEGFNAAREQEEKYIQPPHPQGVMGITYIEWNNKYEQP